jgi:hypothetical protein
MQEVATKLEKTMRKSAHTTETVLEPGAGSSAERAVSQPGGIKTTQQRPKRGDDHKPQKSSEGGAAVSSRLEWVKALAAGGALALSIAAFIWSVHTFRIQEQRLQSQLQLQQDSLKQQRDTDSFKRFVELLPKLGCVADTQREIALELLRTDAPERLRLALSVIEKCPAMTAETAQHLETLKQQAANSEFESAFVFTVANGRQYLLNGLNGAAARTFDAAADALPKTYILNHVLDLDQVTAARRAFSDGRFSEAADLFAKAYRKVPADLGSPSSAFRRGRASNVKNSANQGDAK